MTDDERALRAVTVALQRQIIDLEARLAEAVVLLRRWSKTRSQDSPIDRETATFLAREDGA